MENKLSSIIWLEEPITLGEIKAVVKAYRDPNPVHASTASARKQFGDEATGPVAPGALILGMIGGEITRQFGEDAAAHRLTDIKFSKCFCPGDRLGMQFEIDSDVTRMGRRFVHLLVTAFRGRGDQVVQACRQPRIRVEIACPAAS